MELDSNFSVLRLTRLSIQPSTECQARDGDFSKGTGGQSCLGHVLNQLEMQHIHFPKEIQFLTFSNNRNILHIVDVLYDPGNRSNC